jgi:hypothetical protein
VASRLTRNEAYGTTFDNAGESLVVTFMHHSAPAGRVFAPDGKKVSFNTRRAWPCSPSAHRRLPARPPPLPFPQGQGVDWLRQRSGHLVERLGT